MSRAVPPTFAAATCSLPRPVDLRMRVLVAPFALAANSASASSSAVSPLRWWLAAYMSRNCPASSRSRLAARSQGTSVSPSLSAAASRRYPSITR